MKKIVMVQPKFFNIWESLAFGYIGANLKKHLGDFVELKYYQGYFDEDKTIIEDSIDADIIAFSCTSPTFPKALRISRAIKKENPKVHSVFGGWHVSALPAVIELDGIDQIVVGEGESAFVDIVKGKRDKIIYGIKEDINNLPIPDRKLIKNHREIDLCEKMVGERITSFQSTRVCPAHCAFCSERVVTGLFNKRTNPIRIRNTESVLSEIMNVTDYYNLDAFKFCDATWNISSEKVTEFCNMKIELGFNLPWEANIHATFVTRDMFFKMKEAGCNSINVGCETGSSRIIRKVGKGTTLDAIRNTFRWSKEAGLNRRAHFILGMPDETKDDLKMTEEFIGEIDPDVLGVTIVSPYPGSDMYDSSMPLDFNWEGMDEYTNDIYSTKYLTNEQLKSWQKRITDRYKDKLTWHNKVILEGKEND